MKPRLYLAGPEVFFPDPVAAGEAKKALCDAFGFIGVFPLDSGLDLSGLDGPEAARRIALANEAAMLTCDGMIANMTPFRGPGMDGGTAYEMGFMRALKRVVLGYTTQPMPFAERTHGLCSQPTRTRADGGVEDADGLLIEDFGLSDNLMMAIAVAESGMPVVAETGPMDDLRPFKACLVHARRRFFGDDFTTA